MSAADAASLNWLSWLYTVGAWLVVLGVILEGAEICTRRSAKRKLRRFIGPLQHPLPEPGTPHWAHTAGDIGFLILVMGLIIEQVCHQQMEEITGREGKRLTNQLEAATKLAGDANERAAILESTNLVLRAELAKLEAAVEWRTINPVQKSNIVTFLRPLVEKNVIKTNSNIVISVQPNDVEATWYGRKIFDVLKESGLSVGWFSALSAGGNFWEPPEQPAVGLWFTVKNRLASTVADSVLVAFQNAGIFPSSAEVKSHLPNLPEGDLLISVLHKPEK